MSATVPVFIPCRDRVEALRDLIRWLERAGLTRIYLLDNASTWPPLLEYYETTPHTVVRLGSNLGPYALWQSGWLERLAVTGRFIVTDPDVVPDESCPLDVVDRLSGLLDRHPDMVKAGLGLRLDDIPDTYRLKNELLDWESQFWEHEIEPGVFLASVDTTFALYREHAGPELGPAVRTGSPYLARHTPWYVDEAALSDEDRFYRARVDASGVSNWTGETVPAAFRPVLDARRTRLVVGDAPMLAAWLDEPEVTDEQAFTPWAEPGWPAWNAMSPEVEFCEFVRHLTRMLRPSLVVETGVGQGYTTRRVAAALGPGQALLCFEADDRLRESLARLPFFQASGRRLAGRPTPLSDDLANADLAILDADPGLRLSEISQWWSAAKTGAVLVVHDTGNNHPAETIHAALARQINEHGIPGWFLHNPRGSFLGYKPDRSLAAALAAAEEELRAVRATKSYRWLAPARALRARWLRRRPR